MRQIHVCGTATGRGSRPAARIASPDRGRPLHRRRDSRGHTRIDVTPSSRAWTSAALLEDAPRGYSLRVPGLSWSKGTRTADPCFRATHARRRSARDESTQMRGPRGCLQCHGEIARTCARTRSRPEGAAATATPVHAAHHLRAARVTPPRITSPDPARAGRSEMPGTARWQPDRTRMGLGRRAAVRSPPAGGRARCLSFGYAERIRCCFRATVVQRGFFWGR